MSKLRELSKEIKELIKTAPEKPTMAIKRYNAILINSLHKDSWETGYRDLEIFGVIKSKNGLFVEKIKVSDILNINSFFKQLKGFEISIDILYPENIIHVYCHNYLIEVNGLGIFNFVKDGKKGIRTEERELKKKKQFIAILTIVISFIFFIFNFMLFSLVFPIFTDLYWTLMASFGLAGVYTIIAMILAINYYFSYLEKKGSE